MTFYGFVRWLTGWIMKIKGLKIEGAEHVPPEGGLIVACNHLSNWDVIALGHALRRPIIFMAKEELFNVPVLGFILKKLHAFPVKRGQSDLGSIRQALSILAAGKVLGIFPEGTRSKSGKMQEALSGLVFLMEKGRVPVVPVKVYGTENFFWQKRGKVGIIIGQPLCLDQLTVSEDGKSRRLAQANQIMQCIAKLEETKKE